MKKYLLPVILAAILAITSLTVLTGCGKSDKNSEATTAPSSTAATQPTTKKNNQVTTAPTTRSSIVTAPNDDVNTDSYQGEVEESYESSYNDSVSQISEYNDNNSERSETQSSAAKTESKIQHDGEIPTNPGDIYSDGDPNYVGAN